MASCSTSVVVNVADAADPLIVRRNLDFYACHILNLDVETRETLGQWPHDLRLFAGVVPRLNNIADGDIAPVIARALAPVEEISGGDLELGNMKDDGRERAIVPDIVSGSDG